ncbi:MAG: UDP-N-acetylmuramoyl-L-alanyl-D-glutamate--2,6-diaminopimelate ligase [bacterium]
MILTEILKDLEFKLIQGSLQKEIGSVAYDSRKCNLDSLFVAIKGTKADGHKYINDLISKGISAIVCEDASNISTVNDRTAIIQVKNCRIALSRISKNWYGNPLKNIKVIGVTGTNGKTTITYLLKAIFGKLGYKTGIIGTTGIYNGVEFEDATHTTPESLELFKHFSKMKTLGVEYIFMEVSSHALHQNRVSSIAFDCAIFTNLTHEHLDYHKTMEDYASAKKILFNMLNKKGKAIVNGDDAYADYMIEGIKAEQKIKIGRKQHDDFRIVSEFLNLNETQFTFEYNGQKEVFTTPLIGKFNIDNCAFAISCAKLYGIPDDIIQSAIRKSIGAPGRMQRLKLKNGAIGIIDYSHTPDSLEKALMTCKDILKSSGTESRLICVFGCGGDRDKTKRPLMGKISATIADFSIITDDNPRTENSKHIIDDILKGIEENKLKNVEIIANRKDAIKFAVEISKENDLILIAGKGHENYQIYGKTKNHFDDSEELSFFANLFDSFILATKFLT